MRSPFFQFNLDDFFGQTVFLGNDSSVSMIAFISWVAAFAIGVLCYVFQAVALYSMAKKQGIKPAGLAWVPVLNFYLLGKVADFVGKAEGRNTHRRVTLLVLYLVQIVISVGLSAYLIVILDYLIQISLHGGYYRPYMGDESYVLTAGLIGAFSVILTIVIAILYYVFLMRAVYVILKDRAPRNCALLILLCIFFNYAIGPCLFAVRNKTSIAATKLNFLQRQQEEAEATARYQREQMAKAAAERTEHLNEAPAKWDEIHHDETPVE